MNCSRTKVELPLKRNLGFQIPAYKTNKSGFMKGSSSSTNLLQCLETSIKIIILLPSHCRRCFEGENGLFQSVLLKEVVIQPNVKLECVPNFCYLGDTLGAGGGVEEAARARVRCAWAKFKKLSSILTARGASYHIKGRIYT